MRLATIVGRAKGRSISELTMPLPRNSSRTSTQAITVPATALISTTIREAISVSRSEYQACGLVIEFQNVSQPPSNALNTTAARGISATMLRYDMAMPRPRTSPPAKDLPRPRPTGATGGAGAGAVASLVGGSALPL